MVPRLQGEESIRTANRIAIGLGSMEKSEAQKVIDGWTRAANPDRPKPTWMSVLHAFVGKGGVGVRLVPKKPKASTDDGH